MPHKLLVADDSVTIQRVIQLTFADQDIEVIAASDGRQAIERARTERPDIVLADIGMPGCDGYEVAAFIKGDPQLSGIPVVLLTGAFEPVDEDHARRLGCDGVLVKPFEPQMVVARVKELLARRDEAGYRTPAGMGANSAAPDSAAGSESTAPPAQPSTATEVEPSRDPLEDYFDRLDAAFASVGAPRPTAAARVESGDVASPAPELDRYPHDPAPQAADPLTEWDSGSIGGFGPERQPHLASAFASLFAAEHGLAVPAAPAEAAPAVISEELIEQIVERVISRMSDDSMRRAVLETAERLVREEIDRIKRMSASRDARSGG